MAPISQFYLNKFISQDINLSSRILTENLTTIHRFNFIGRFFQRKTLDSRKICENLEKAINGFHIVGEKKEITLKNLDAMQEKFSKSLDQKKAQDCIDTIKRIKDSLNNSSIPNQPVAPRSSKTRDQSMPSAVAHAEQPPVAPQPPSQLSRSAVEARKHTTQTTDPVIALRNAISRDTREVHASKTHVKGLQPDEAKIRELEKGLTEILRKQTGNYVKMIHYPWAKGCKFFYVALKKEKVNGFETVKHVLVPAIEIDQFVTKRSAFGKFDVGALLREKRAEMHLSPLPFETSNQ